MTSSTDRARPRSYIWPITAATVVQVIAFGSIMVGVFASQSEDPEAGGIFFALGFALVPVVCAVTAFATRHPRAPMATLKGMGAWLVIGLPVSLLHPVIGLTAGFTAAGAITLRSDVLRPGRYRAYAIGAMVLYEVVLLAILPQAALLAGAVSPLLAVRLADLFTEKKEEALES